MSINNKFLTRNKIRLISNSHVEERDMLLDKLLKNADMSQATFAKKVGKDASTVNRWIKNNRSIAWDNAEKIAEVLNCHPVDIYKPKKEIMLNRYCKWDGYVCDIDKGDRHLITVPYELYHENIRAIQMQVPGFHTDGEVWLFDLPSNKKFSKYAIGKICYITASKNFIKKNKKFMSDLKDLPDPQTVKPLIALLTASGNGKMDIVNSYTNEPINDLCKNITPDDIEYATPVKAKYDPDLFNFTIK